MTNIFKYISVLFFLLLFTNTSFAQNLVLGYLNPNVDSTLDGGSYSYDTVYIVNNAVLNISNHTQFTVNGAIVLAGNAQLNVENSSFNVNNIFYAIDNATINLKDSLNITANIYVSDSAKLLIDNAIVDVPMLYKDQYVWVAAKQAVFDIRNSYCDFNNGALGGGAVNTATFNIYNTEFSSAILPMTFGFSDSCTVNIDSCVGGMELVLADATTLNLSNSDFFVIWYTFENGDSLNYEYPPMSSIVYNNASNITQNYNFSSTSTNSTNSNLNANFTNVDGIYWGIISKTNSYIQLNNSTLIATGIYYDSNSIDTLSAFNNAQHYQYYNAPLTDRSYILNNSTVSAWNFYASDTSKIIIEDCLFGESIGFNDGIVIVENSLCDGTGGFFGGMNNSKTYVYNSQINRLYGGVAHILKFQDNARAWLHNSSVIGPMSLSNNAQLFFANTTYTNTTQILDNSFFAEVYIDTITSAWVDFNVTITGTVDYINAPQNNSVINRYIIAISNIDSTNFNTIKDTSASSIQINNNTLAQINTNGYSSGYYLLWCTIFMDGDTAISAVRNINFMSTSINENALESINIYPNPSNAIFNIQVENFDRLEVFNIDGKLILSSQNNIINMQNQAKGQYFAVIYTKNKQFTRKIILN